MLETDRFIDNFEKLLRKEDNSAEQNDNAGIKSYKKAETVIKSVSKYGQNEMTSQNVINLFFADHGWNHSVRLSDYASFMINNLKAERKESFSDIDWNNMLVLLWTAIALHDIGMNDIAADEKDLMNIIKEQGGRVDHVKKSGERISNIIDNINSISRMKENIADFVNAWTDYWDMQQAADPTTALRMVKDIVLMHGEDKNWLVEDKIGSLDRNVFSDIDQKYKEIYIRIISYDEALLCLSDLLDICRERMNIFNNDNLNEYFNQMDANKKRHTFEHWVSHNITSVKNDYYKTDGYFYLEMYKYTLDSKMYLNNVLNNVYKSLGAIEACLKWGNDERLKTILEDFGYKGIKSHLCIQNSKTWQCINKKADSFNIYDNKHIININSPLKGTSNYHINDLICRWIKNNWSVDENSDFYCEFKDIYSLFSEGAALHLLYDKKTAEIHTDSIGYFIEMQDNARIVYDINDAFLAAVNLFFEIYDQRENIFNIKIITKGDGNFSSLYNNANSDRKTAYIIIIKNYVEDNLNKIIEAISKKEDDSFAIFICRGNKVNSNMIKQNCQKVEYIINEDNFRKIKSPLNEYALKKWANKNKANDKEKKQVENLLNNNKIGLGSFLECLKIIYNGIYAISESIVSDLKKYKYDRLFILSLFEMLSKNINGCREIGNEELEFFYDKFYAQRRNKICQMADYKTTKTTLLNLCDEHDGKIRLRNEYSNSFENLIINSSKDIDYNIKKELFQTMIFFWLYNYQKVNFKSVCYREYLTYLPPGQLCSYILNPNINLIERISISFETSEILVDKLRQNTNDTILKEFVKQYLIELLKGRKKLSTNEDFICFQSIYRIFRGILAPNMEDVIRYIIDIIIKAKSHVGYLGFIEGVCSADLNKDKQLECVTSEHFEEALKDIFAYPDSGKNVQYMAYDILFKYKKDDLRQEFHNDSWENICVLLHSKIEPTGKDKDQVYKEWKKMRNRFMKILDNTPKSIRPRNMFDDKVKREV